MDSFGDFEILERIAQGGMGVVYKARDRRLDRIVALKTLRAGAQAGAEEQARFQREAQAAARLSHPNIVAVHAVGVHEGQSWFTMDYVEGETLETQMQRVVFREAAALELGAGVARGLACAHAHGIAHRDLKPANILVDREGRPRITDFGLAKDLDSNLDLTRSGAILGTLHYLSPEQARGESHRIDGRADIYALGVILYEMATDTHPYDGETHMEVLERIATGEAAPPRRINPAISRDYQTICLKAMSPRIEDRYAQAADLADDLERARRGEPILARAQTRLQRARRALERRRMWGRAIILVLLLVPCGLTFARLTLRDQDLEAFEWTEATRHHEIAARWAARGRARELAEEEAARERQAAELRARKEAEERDWTERRERAVALNIRAGDLAVRGRSMTLVRSAIAAHTEAIEVDPELAESYLLRARAHYRLGEDAAALEDARKVEALETARPEGPYLAALALLRQAAGGNARREPPPGELAALVAGAEEAVARLETLASGSALALAARAALDILCVRDIDDVLPRLARALDLEPTLPEPYFLRATLLGNYDLAIEHYRGANKTRLWSFQAEHYAPQQAQEDIEQFVDLESFSRDGLLVLAHLRKEARDYPGALESYARCLELFPDDPLPRIQRGRLHFMFGRHREARADLEPVPLDPARPENGTHVLALMGIYLLEEQPTAARALIRGTLPRVTGRPRGLMLAVLAILDAAEGDIPAARASWEEAVSQHAALRRFRDEGGELAGVPPELRELLIQGMDGLEQVFEVEAAQRARILEVERLRVRVPQLRAAWEGVHLRSKATSEMQFVSEILMRVARDRLAEGLRRLDQEVLVESTMRLREAFALVAYIAQLARGQDLCSRPRLYTVEDYYLRACARYRRGEVEAAWADLVAARGLDPSHRPTRLGQALIRARQGKVQAATRLLFDAVVLGFRDLERIERDPDFREVVQRPAFQRLKLFIAAGF